VQSFEHLAQLANHRHLGCLSHANIVRHGLLRQNPSRTASAFFGFATCLKSTSSAFKYWLPLNNTLTAKRLLLKCGMVIDVTLIASPSSTKNSSGERGPEMHQTKKGSQWHFGNKALIVVDADSGLVHSAVETAANVNDVTQAG
jgi:IS5 family transposase